RVISNCYMIFHRVNLMRNYNTGVSGKVFASVIAAVVITAGVVALAVYYPGDGGTIPDEPTGLGARTADFLNSMRDNVEFYFICNSTLVNQDITDFYAQSQPGAFVDGIRMNRTPTGGAIEVLFSPYHAGIVGSGEITTTEWNSISGLIVDDGIGEMEEPTSPPGPNDFPTSFPIDLYFGIYFDDNTCFIVGYTSTDGLVFLQNGTWTGEFVDGWPVRETFEDGAWLEEGGYLTAAIEALYTTITTAVDYPE
ncbi:MAG: hypothetical protein ACFFEE_04385, partial [Candidatus Thorarchaeota archaeon]